MSITKIILWVLSMLLAICVFSRVKLDLLPMATLMLLWYVATDFIINKLTDNDK